MLCSDFTAKKKTILSMALGNGYRRKSLLTVTCKQLVTTATGQMEYYQVSML